MTMVPVPLAEITDTAIRVLSREIGAVNTARFLNQFTTGFGNYTEERDQIVGERTVDELAAEIRQQKPHQKGGSERSVRKRPRPTRR